RSEEDSPDEHATLLQPSCRLDRERRARGVTPQESLLELTLVDLVDDLFGHLRQRRERLVLGGQVVPGQLDAVDAEPGASKRGCERLEVQRVAAGVREADQ